MTKKLPNKKDSFRTNLTHTVKDILFISLGVISAGFGLKGFLLPNSLLAGGFNGSSSDAVKYRLDNRYFYSGDHKKSKTLFDEILKGKVWTSFGYIAAENDMVNYFNDQKR